MGKFKHGMNRSKLHNTIIQIVMRCENPNNPSYKNYGGRGIQLCEEWRHDYKKFFDWAFANGYTEELTIDRIDVNGDYTPENCRWVDRAQQANNKRNNHLLTIHGETHNIAEWAAISGISRNTIRMRLVRGWGYDELLLPTASKYAHMKRRSSCGKL